MKSKSKKSGRKSSTGTSEKDAPREDERPVAATDAAEGNSEPLFWIDTETNNGALPFAEPSAGEEEPPQETRVGKKKRARSDSQGQGKAKEKTREEELLESVVFGSKTATSLFSTPLTSTRDDDELDNAAHTPEEDGLRPAWHDEDEEEVEVDLSAKDRLRKLRKTLDEDRVDGKDYEQRLRARFGQQQPAGFLDWAQVPEKGRGEGDDDEDEEEEIQDSDLFSSTAALVGGKASGARLPQGSLEVFRVRDANVQAPSKAVVQSVKFHPTNGLMLTGGFDKTLRLFQIDGRANAKVSGIFLPDMPIQTAAFINAQDDSFRQVVVSGRRPFFYWADIETGAVGKVPRIMGREEKSLERFAASSDGRWLTFTGTDGTLLLLSAKTKQWVGSFKMNGTARAVAFSADSTTLYGSGGDATVYRWDLRSQKCLGRFSNEGGTVTSSLATAGYGAMGYTAVGSESGVVNVYDSGHVATLRHAREAGNLRPLKALMNLTTTIDSLGFNHDHQILALASRWSRDSLKLVHVPSMTVFANWPTGSTPLRYVTAFDFSPHSGYFAVGNDRGKVLLYRLRHYDAF